MILRWITGLCMVWVLCSKAADVAFRFEDGSCSASKQYDKDYRGTFKSGGDDWTLDYKFPKLTYGYSERAVEQKISFPMPESLKNAREVSVSLYNETDTGHAFMIRLTGENGTEWDSPPVIMNGKNSWRNVAFPLSDFQNFRKEGKKTPDGRIKTVSLVVQQAITSRLATLGVARRGVVKFKDFTISDQAEEAGLRMFFAGKVFTPATVEPFEFKSTPLHFTRNGKSAAYPARGAIPFERGVVRNPENIRLTENGKEVPVGIEVLSRWADNSIRAVRLSSAAEITGARQYVLEYGTRISRKDTGRKLGSENAGTVVVDTGSIHAEFTPGGDSLLKTLNVRGKTIFTGLAASFDGKTVLKEKKIALETNNTEEAVVKVSGLFAEGGYSFHARFIFIRNSSGVRVNYTFVNRDGKEFDTAFPEIALTGNWGTRATRWSFGEFCPFSSGSVTLIQDGAHYKSDKRIIKSTLLEDGKIQKEMDRFDGIWHVETPAGTIGFAIADAWQNNPKTVKLSPETFRIGLSSQESINNKSKNPRNFFKGMAKTHRMLLSFDEPEMAADFVKQPMLTASPEYLCASSVFGRIAPVDKRNFPLFESVSESWTGSRFETDRYFGDMYGLRDFGDWSAGRKGAAYMNLETGGGMAFLIQFVRSGDPAMLDEAFRSNLHYIDIDTCHADIDPMKPGRTIGAVYAHRPDHVASVKEPMKPDLAYVGVNGHDWYPEVAFMYLLTGEEVFRDASLFHAEATVKSIEQEFDPNHVLAREYAWPVKNLMAFHMVNPDPRYVKAAAKVMNFFAFWRNAFGSGRLGNTLGQPGVCLEAIAYYYRETNDPQAAELLKTATKLLVDGTYISPEDGLPSDSLYNEDARMMFLNAVTEYFRVTGDRKMVERFIPYLYFHLRHPATLVDSTIPWCAPEFIKIMGELQLKEPIAKSSIPIWHSSFSARNAQGELDAELRFCQKTDEPFTITVSRIAAMRLGRFTRGLVVGDWQGYPDSVKNELKTSEPELQRENYGIITVISPDGKEILRDSIRNYVSNVKTFDVPSDGKTGVYRILLRTADKINLTFQVSVSRPGLALVSRDGLPWLQTVFIPVASADTTFSAIVTQRRPSPGGGRLTAPDGKIIELFNNPNLNYEPEAVFTGRGTGVWKLERSMLNNISPLKVEGMEPLLCPSREDAQVFVDYGRGK